MREIKIDISSYCDQLIARCTVAFLNIENNEPSLIGSGTLVKFKNSQGILTCAHVTMKLKKIDNIGLCAFPVRHERHQNFTLGKEFPKGSILEIYNQGSADGPDIGLVPLSAEQFSSISAIASHIDLELHKNPTFLDNIDTYKKFVVVSGAIDEMTPKAIVEERMKTLKIKGLLNIGTISKVIDKDNFDLVEFEPEPAIDFELPKSYGGTSGGGIWEMYLKIDKEGVVVEQKHQFIGVAFYQTKEGKIIGHGKRTVFDLLLPKIP